MNQLRSWRNSPWVRENSVTQHIIGEEEHRVWFGRQLISPRHVARVIVADGVDVGLVTLTRSLQVGGRDEQDTDALPANYDTGSWGIYLGQPTVAGRGIGLAAATLSLDGAFAHSLVQVTCEVFAQNARARALYGRLGFRGEPPREDDLMPAPVEAGALLVLHLSADRWRLERPAVVATCRERSIQLISGSRWSANHGSNVGSVARP